MDMIVLDPSLKARIIQDRRERRADRYDEVWNGIYVVSPIIDNEHCELVATVSRALYQALPEFDRDRVSMGVNVSDRNDDWEQNYRCPDVVVFLEGCSAEDRDTHYYGGPDFAVEIVNRHDRSREKFDFYAKVNTRELLIVDRYPWALELYRLNASQAYVIVGRSTLEQPEILESRVLPLSFQLGPGEERPAILVKHSDGVQTWSA